SPNSFLEIGYTNIVESSLGHFNIALLELPGRELKGFNQILLGVTCLQIAGTFVLKI
ncbi:hypothetical protein RYX36_020025, partial [Vicia faba]